jgi:hypothetical protein
MLAVLTLPGVSAAEPERVRPDPRDVVNPPPALTEATFARLFDACRPRVGEERWAEVPWIGELWEGRRKAAREKRPLFIWAMNGSPLGCV